ncbi:hypothetical protein HispidOSU_021667, partial [Sigmodon hispidus]
AGKDDIAVYIHLAVLENREVSAHTLGRGRTRSYIADWPHHADKYETAGKIKNSKVLS